MGGQWFRDLKGNLPKEWREIEGVNMTEIFYFSFLQEVKGGDLHGRALQTSFLHPKKKKKTISNDDLLSIFFLEKAKKVHLWSVQSFLSSTQSQSLYFPWPSTLLVSAWKRMRCCVMDKLIIIIIEQHSCGRENKILFMHWRL